MGSSWWRILFLRKSTKKESGNEPLLMRKASILVALAEKISDRTTVLRLVSEDAAASDVQAGVAFASEAERWTTVATNLRDRDDAELVALALAGQSNAFEALYRRHSPYAMSLAVRVQGSATDVEDIVHDSFLKVHDRLDELRSGASFRAWLSSVVVSHVRTRLRKRRFFGVFGGRGDEGVDLDAVVAEDASPEVRAQLAQVYALLRRASVDQSICWTLRFIEGRKLEDVAHIAGCSLATAKRRIFAVQQLLLSAQGSEIPLEDGSSHD